jgi:hypothetical protein
MGANTAGEQCEQSGNEITNSPAYASAATAGLCSRHSLIFPMAAYVLAAGFDVISVIGGSGHAWASELWHAATFALITRLALCLMTMLSGFADLIRFDERQPAAVDQAVHEAYAKPRLSFIAQSYATAILESGDTLRRLMANGLSLRSLRGGLIRG